MLTDILIALLIVVVAAFLGLIVHPLLAANHTFVESTDDIVAYVGEGK